MADFADLGADREEKDRALALKVRAPEGLPDGLRWCDAECRDTWQAEQKVGR